MKTRSYRIAAAAALAVLMLAAPGILATEELADKEGLECTACHDKPGSKLMTDKGKYYETLGTMEGYDELTADFGKCTSCHVRKPGSLKLTKKGKQLAESVENMAELKKLVMEKHPKTSKTD